MIAPAWGRPIEPWKEGESRKLKDCLQKKIGKKKKMEKEKKRRQTKADSVLVSNISS